MSTVKRVLIAGISWIAGIFCLLVWVGSLLSGVLIDVLLGFSFLFLALLFIPPSRRLLKRIFPSAVQIEYVPKEGSTTKEVSLDRSEVVDILGKSLLRGVWNTFKLALIWWFIALIILLVGFSFSEEISLFRVVYSKIGLLVWVAAFTLLSFFMQREEVLEEKRKEDLRQKEVEKARKRYRKKQDYAKKQRAKGLYQFEDKWVTEEEFKQLKELRYGLQNNFQSLTPFEFEEFIAKLFTAMGYEAHATEKTGDYGIDVIAKKDGETLAIQCKRYRKGNAVGNGDVQKLLGAMQKSTLQADHSVLITTSHFTVQAKEQAKECAIELWDGKTLKKLVRKYLMNLDA